MEASVTHLSQVTHCNIVMFARDQGPAGAQGHSHPDADSCAFAELPCRPRLLSESEGQRKWIQLQNNSLEIKTFVV